MAQKYRKIDTRIWWDEKFSQLTPTAKFLCVYLLSNDRTKRIGLFCFSLSEAAECIGCTPEAARAAFDELRESLGWMYHAGTRTLLIPNWFKYNPPGAPQNLFGANGALADFHDVPDSYLKGEFISLLTAFCDQWGYREGLAQAMPKLCPGYADAMPHTQEQEQEQEQDKNPPLIPPLKNGGEEVTGDDRGERASPEEPASPDQLEGGYDWDAAARSLGYDPDAKRPRRGRRRQR